MKLKDNSHIKTWYAVVYQDPLQLDNPMVTILFAYKHEASEYVDSKSHIDAPYEYMIVEVKEVSYVQCQ